MSAFMCDNRHFNVITSYFVGQYRDEGLWLEIDGVYEYLNKLNANIVAEILHDENARSLNSRYGDNIGDFNDYSFTYLPDVKREFTALEIAGAIDCLEYQSCESDDYYSTKAYSILCLMRKHLLNELQPENKTWSIYDLQEATA